MTLLEDPPSRPLEHRFGLTPAFTLGIEDELLIVDRDGRHLLPIAEQLVADLAPSSGRICSEIFAAEVELVTPICSTIAGAGTALDQLAAAIRGAGTTLIGAGLHPSASFVTADLSRSERYARVSDSLRGLLRTPPASLHVHVGMPDAETAIRVCNGLRTYLPLLHSLAANSPFWYGRDSGLASARVAILRSYPRYGIPRWFRDWAHFCEVAQDLADAAGVEDYTYFWWEVRPHPRLGTVEVRAPDAQFSSQRTLAVAALIHALVRLEAEAPLQHQRSQEAIAESCYQATRYGLDALIPDRAGARRPAREVAYQTVREVRPYARELGCEGELAGIERILHEGNGADVQRRLHRRLGMRGLLSWLVGQRNQQTGGSSQ